MIKAEALTMKFDDYTALNRLSAEIPDGCVYGLVGSNGAGKSTLLRLLSGVYRPSEGTVTVDGAPVYENPEVKKNIVYISDDLYFLPQSDMCRMAELYAALYKSFSYEKYEKLIKTFGLNPKKNFNTFSKGMRRQAATVLAVSAQAKYIFFDETFDGLDPVMRKLVKSVIYADIEERNATAIITSHSLRELEDTCDQLALLHNGGIIFESDIQNLKTSLFKVQVAFREEFGKDDFADIEILDYSQKGSVANLIVRGDRESIYLMLKKRDPLVLDMLPLSLEEVFTYEMEVLGYSFKEILM